MTDQKKPQEEPEATTEESAQQPEEQHDRFKDATDNIKETTEKIWDNTRQAWGTATFKANQYKQLVQKKIDLSALHKKINAAHGDLGKLIDDLREAGKKSIMNLAEVKEILQRLDDLKVAAAALEEEIENVRNAEKQATTQEKAEE
jgi:hypothetical protein